MTKFTLEVVPYGITCISGIILVAAAMLGYV